MASALKTVGTLLGGFLLLGAGAQAAPRARAPEFPARAAQDWINSAPLALADLRGQVVLIDFWTFDCWNCYRSFPWLNELGERLQARGLRVIGVHTPEFEHEKDLDRIRAKVAEFGLHHPVMVDSDRAYWQAMDNRYWPAYYLIDREGRVAAAYAGETHAGDRQARTIEAAIEQLLGAPARAP